MGSARLVYLLSLGLAACGEVNTDPIDAPGSNGDGGGTGTDGASIDGPDIDAPTDACVPFIGVTAQFTATNIYGTGTSTLDRILNHPNGLILNFTDHTIARGIDNGPVGAVQKTTVRSTLWMADYTGQDGDFLDTEVGAFLSVGGAYMQGIFDLGDNSIFLYVLPTQTNVHPYMDMRCNSAGLQTDANGFPILETHTYTGCSTTFFDFRPNVQRNVVANANTQLEITYRPCP